MEDNTEKNHRNTYSNASLFTAVSEAASSVIKLTQANVIERVESGVRNVVRGVALTIVATVLGVAGGLFLLTGLAIWLGNATQYGTWFGLMIVGIFTLLIALIANLMRKAHK